MFFVLLSVVAIMVVGARCEVDLELAVANTIIECAKTNNVSAADLVKLRQAKEKSTLNADEGLKCLTKCIIDAHDLISADGIVNVDRVVEVSGAQGKDKDVSRAAAQRCSVDAANKDCEDAWRMYTCFSGLH